MPRIVKISCTSDDVTEDIYLLVTPKMKTAFFILYVVGRMVGLTLVDPEEAQSCTDGWRCMPFITAALGW